VSARLVQVLAKVWGRLGWAWARVWVKALATVWGWAWGKASDWASGMEWGSASVWASGQLGWV